MLIDLMFYNCFIIIMSTSTDLITELFRVIFAILKCLCLLKLTLILQLVTIGCFMLQHAGSCPSFHSPWVKSWLNLLMTFREQKQCISILFCFLLSVSEYNVRSLLAVLSVIVVIHFTPHYTLSTIKEQQHFCLRAFP